MSATAEVLPINARCGAMLDVGADETGERAVECNAPACVECEHCGPLCANCYEETFCIFSQHKIVASRAVIV